MKMTMTLTVMVFSLSLVLERGHSVLIVSGVLNYKDSKNAQDNN